MKILIALGSITPNDDANSNIAKLLAGELVRQGHEVTLLGMAFQACDKRENMDGIHYHRIVNLCPPKRGEINRLFERANTAQGKVKVILHHPLWFFGTCVRWIRARFFDQKELLYVREFRHLLHREKFDRIIAITSPFYVATALMRTKTKIPTIWYQLDPNLTNHSAAYQGKKNLAQKETKWYRFIQYAVVPKLVYKENQSNLLAQFVDKMIPANFPNVRKITSAIQNEGLSLDNTKVNLLFTGTFYEDIRNPLPLFDLISRMNDPQIQLHIVGGGCLDMIQEWTQKCPSIVYHGYHPASFAEQMTVQADILVNVDNLSANMLPSKINDYISTGKPILNMHPVAFSACAQYLEHYPLHLNVLTEEKLSDESVQKIAEFCKSHKYSRVPFSEIEQNYHESTPEFVANLLLRGSAHEEIS
ncbi:MAG: hypothetical protein J6K84_05690 [Oscillospiraceae bacterium]|nr:hypothetical protein [Oscillospiraceae bacterium]